MPWMTVDGADIDSAAVLQRGNGFEPGRPCHRRSRMSATTRYRRGWRSRRSSVGTMREASPRAILFLPHRRARMQQVVASSTNAHSAVSMNRGQGAEPARPAVRLRASKEPPI